MANRISSKKSGVASSGSKRLGAAWLVCAGVLVVGLSIADLPGAAAPKDSTDATATGNSLPASWIPVPGYSAKAKVPHGQIKEVMYDNTVLGKTGNNGRKANVYTPPGYDETQKYPVLYALHGIGGDHKEWLSSKPQEILDNLYAAKKIVPMIVVFPNGRAMNPDTCPKDMFGGANSRGFYDLWDKDMRDFLIPFIEKTYSVQADKEHRAIMGYSMGGMQALRFGLGNPNHFAYVGSLAPAFRPDVSALNPADVNKQFRQFFLRVCEGIAFRIFSLSHSTIRNRCCRRRRAASNSRGPPSARSTTRICRDCWQLASIDAKTYVPI